MDDKENEIKPNIDNENIPKKTIRDNLYSKIDISVKSLDIFIIIVVVLLVITIIIAML